MLDLNAVSAWNWTPFRMGWTRFRSAWTANRCLFQFLHLYEPPPLGTPTDGCVGRSIRPRTVRSLSRGAQKDRWFFGINRFWPFLDGRSCKKSTALLMECCPCSDGPERRSAVLEFGSVWANFADLKDHYTLLFASKKPFLKSNIRFSSSISVS